MENKKTTKNINLNYTFIQQRDLNKIKYFKDCKNFFEDLNKIIENNGNNFQQLYILIDYIKYTFQLSKC